MKEKKLVICDDCDRPMYRIVTGGSGFIISENNSETSAKPDSYFANAEQNRKKALKKRKKDEREKIHYKDKQTVAKLEGKLKAANIRGEKAKAQHTERILEDG